MPADIPVVVIVGRPNVGKSSIFNAVLGKRVSIVDERAGVTRDRISADIEYEGSIFQLVDTGGIGIVDSDELEEDVEKQINIAIETADLVLFVVDARTGLTTYDENISIRLRDAGKNTLLIANKCDTLQQELDSTDFFKLGLGEPLQMAATERRGYAELIRRVIESLPDMPSASEMAEPVMKVAFVGRRNVGKSTLINALAGEERVIVSSVPGTTRDAVDVSFDYKGTSFVAIDTAGMRKHRQIKEDIDYYSLTRGIEAIKRADVVIHMFDAPSEISQVDKKLAATVGEYYKPCVLVENKMDLAVGVDRSAFVVYVRERLPWLLNAPVVMMSAMKKENIDHVIEAASVLYEQCRSRVSTGRLNATLERALQRRRPPRQGNKFAKIYYATQVGVQPPTIALFVNNPQFFDEPYLRYLAHQLQETLPFSRVPIKFLVRGRQRDGISKKR